MAQMSLPEMFSLSFGITPFPLSSSGCRVTGHEAYGQFPQDTANSGQNRAQHFFILLSNIRVKRIFPCFYPQNMDISAENRKSPIPFIASNDGNRTDSEEQYMILEGQNNDKQSNKAQSNLLPDERRFRGGSVNGMPCVSPL